LLPHPQPSIVALVASSSRHSTLLLLLIMGCCSSSPHSRRKYKDPADLDEVIVPLRKFGQYRNGTTNIVPDDIDGLPSTHNYKHLASDPDTLL